MEDGAPSRITERCFLSLEGRERKTWGKAVTRKNELG
jgi:hypothetical protein